MALTISTGFVVDDAIVMIENIARYIEEGEPPFEAALKGAKQIGFTIVSLTVSLVAVLIPLLFMGGIIGRLFREFAVTLSHRHRRLGGALAHAHRHDVRAPAAARTQEPQRAGCAVFERALRRGWSRSTTARLEVGAAPPARSRCVVTVATLVAHGAARARHPQGLLPAAGHRPHRWASPRRRPTSRSRA